MRFDDENQNPTTEQPTPEQPSTEQTPEQPQ